MGTFNGAYNFTWGWKWYYLHEHLSFIEERMEDAFHVAQVQLVTDLRLPL